MLKTSFWQNAANSLPAHVRERYAGYFEMAERWELVLDVTIEAWSRVKMAIDRRFQSSHAKHGH